MFIVPNAIRVFLFLCPLAPNHYWGTCLPLSVQFLAISRRVNILPLRSTVSRLACPDSLIPRLSFCLVFGDFSPSKVPATCPLLRFCPQVFLVFSIIWFSSRGYPASNSAPLIRHFVLSNLRNLKVVL